MKYMTFMLPVVVLVAACQSAPQHRADVQDDSADRVLIDAPCSGLGVLRRNPDAKWKLQPEFIEKIKVTQQEIIQQYSKMVKTGGQMVYATCSILPSENKTQVDTFLDSDMGKSFTFVKDKKVSAHKSGFDGFYMALLERKL